MNEHIPGSAPPPMPPMPPRQPPKAARRSRPFMLMVPAVALILALGLWLGITAAKPDPTEPMESAGMQTPPETTVPPDAWKANILRSDEIPRNHNGFYTTALETYPVFGSDYQREQITAVTFYDTLVGAPQDAWDVSEAGNGSVLAWVKPDGDWYQLYIAAEGGVSSGTSCRDLFAGYSNMQWIIFGDRFHTEAAVNMSNMFYACEELINLHLDFFDTSNVQDMSSMFFWCMSLTSLELSNFDTSNVQDMSSMFSACYSLTSLTLSNLDTSNVQDMSYMFQTCTSLTSLELNSFDTSKVQYMRWMFSNCSSLTSLVLSSFDTSNVLDMNWMFNNCSSLTSLVLSSFDTSNVLDMNWMFNNCSSLTSLILGEKFVTTNADTTDMFFNCPAGADWKHLLNN